jgi:uncharacterized damage-inducible protein DinB
MIENENLIETWGIMTRITLYLLDHVPSEALGDQVASGQGRSVGRVFGHIHTARLMWLEAHSPEFAEGLKKVEPDKVNDKAALRTALEASDAAMEKMLAVAAEAGAVNGFRRSPLAFLGYLIAHESYHHGEIGIMLDLSGHKMEDKIVNAIWDWGKI